MDDPIVFLLNPPEHNEFKRYCKRYIFEFWDHKLQSEVRKKESLKFLNPNNCSIFTAHPVYSTCIGNPYETSKAIIQATMLCGQYPVEKLTGKYRTTPIPTDFACSICDGGSVGSLPHLLLHCQGVELARNRAVTAARDRLRGSLYLSAKFEKVMVASDNVKTQFLLDPCSENLSTDVRTCKNDTTDTSIMYHIGRTWCYSVHQERKKKLKVNGK